MCVISLTLGKVSWGRLTSKQIIGNQHYIYISLGLMIQGIRIRLKGKNIFLFVGDWWVVGDDEGNVMKQIQAREDKVQSEKCSWR